MNSMPGVLTAVRVILFIWAGLAGLFSVIGLIGLSSMPESQVQALTGMGSGAVFLFGLIGLALIAFELYVASTMGQGGHRTRMLVRTVVTLNFVNMGINLLMGGNILLALVLTIIILILNESASAKDWYEETENPQPHRRS